MGLSPKQIHVRRSRGDLVDVLPGVLRLAGAPDSFEGRLLATSLWLDGGGFFNGPTAAFLYGLEGIEQPTVISIARYSGSGTADWITAHRLGKDDTPRTRLLRGYRICRVERALAECCAILPARVVGRAVDDALSKRLTTIHRLREFAERWGMGRPGATLFRQLVGSRDPDDAKMRSELERRTRAILCRIRDHQFLPDHEVEARGRRYFIDFFLPTAALGIECHSRRWHLGRHLEDARRDRDIRSTGDRTDLFHLGGRGSRSRRGRARDT